MVEAREVVDHHTLQVDHTLAAGLHTPLVDLVTHKRQIHIKETASQTGEPQQEVDLSATTTKTWLMVKRTSRSMNIT